MNEYKRKYQLEVNIITEISDVMDSVVSTWGKKQKQGDVEGSMASLLNSFCSFRNMFISF